MNKNIDTLITVLGWEDRFRLSNEIIINKCNIKKILLITFSDYFDMKNMSENQEFLSIIAREANIEIIPIKLEYSDSVNNWKILDSFFENYALSENTLINISTIPRETIWMLLFFLKKNITKIDYIYFKPKKYCSDWLTKNHKNPRLLFKHSGLFGLDKKLVLFIVTGFDENRLNSIIEFYEPDEIVFFKQEGTQFGNMDRNTCENIDTTIVNNRIDIDNYNINNAVDTISKEVERYSDYNIIIDSQGPKVSAISTYKIHLLSEKEIALAYVPSRDFSSTYSTGIDEKFIEDSLEV